MARELPAYLFQFRIRNQRLRLALRLRITRSKMTIQQLAEKLIVPHLEKQLAAEMAELQFVPGNEGD